MFKQKLIPDEFPDLTLRSHYSNCFGCPLSDSCGPNPTDGSLARQPRSHIQAHCGGVIKEGDEWYWFGEDRAKENDLEKNKRFVACYSSKDLVHWTFRNKVLKLDMPNKLPIRELSYARSDQNAEPISSSHPNSTKLWKRPP
jgi:hypothetical protein